MVTCIFQWGYLGTVPNYVYQTLCVQELNYCSGDGVATGLENSGKFKSENKTGFGEFRSQEKTGKYMILA